MTKSEGYCTEADTFYNDESYDGPPGQDSNAAESVRKPAPLRENRLRDGLLLFYCTMIVLP